MENLERLESSEGCQDLVGFESIWGNLVIGYCCWRSDIELFQFLYVAE